MPPVGQNRTFGKGAATELSQRTPPDDSAGKNFSTRNPKSISIMTSDTVEQPGNAGTGASVSASARSGDVPGLARNAAPASQARETSSRFTTVPMPATTSGTSAMIARNAESAASVRNVTSITERPPVASARASGTASSTRPMVRTGMTGVVNNGPGSACHMVLMWVSPHGPRKNRG
jgi:hypothetical protein